MMVTLFNFQFLLPEYDGCHYGIPISFIKLNFFSCQHPKQNKKKKKRKTWNIKYGIHCVSIHKYTAIRTYVCIKAVYTHIRGVVYVLKMKSKKWKLKSIRMTKIHKSLVFAHSHTSRQHKHSSIAVSNTFWIRTSTYVYRSVCSVLP